MKEMRWCSLFVVASLGGLASTHLGANEPHYTPPSIFKLSGNDHGGNPAYVVQVALSDIEEGQTVRSIEVEVYGEKYVLPEAQLRQITRPRPGEMDVFNDCCIFGSSFSFYIPFGNVGSCRKAKRRGERSSLVIFSPSAGKAEYSSSVFDPCE